jgi:hypothetical protein
VPPHAGELLEIRLAIARVAGIVPEMQRHRRGRARDHEFADFVEDFLTRLVPRVHVHAERTRLNLARVRTGCIGVPPTHAAHTSVPPDGEFTHRSALTFS